MNSTYKDVEELVKEVQVLLDNDHLRATPNLMRQAAEYVDSFYYEKWDLAEKYMAKIKSKKPIQKELMPLKKYHCITA